MSSVEGAVKGANLLWLHKDWCLWLKFLFGRASFYRFSFHMAVEKIKRFYHPKKQIK